MPSWMTKTSSNLNKNRTEKLSLYQYLNKKKGELIQFDPFFSEVNYESPYYKEFDKRKDNDMIQNTKTDVKKKVCDFFFYLIQRYQKSVLKGRPLVLIIEDCQRIDLISNTFICNFRERMNNPDTKLSGVFLICTYQVGVTELNSNQNLNFHSFIDIFFNQEFSTPSSDIAKVYSIKFLSTFRLQIPQGDLPGIISGLCTLLKNNSITFLRKNEHNFESIIVS